MTNKEAYDVIAKYAINDFKDKELETAISIALDALWKTIPQKPTNNASHESNGRIIYDISQYRCPTCASRLKSGLGSSSRYRNNICNHCGQHIDWSEVS